MHVCVCGAVFVRVDEGVLRITVAVYCSGDEGVGRSCIDVDTASFRYVILCIALTTLKSLTELS